MFSLFFLSASGCTTNSHYPGDLLPPHTFRVSQTPKYKHTYEHTSPVQHLNPLHSLLSLSSSYVGLFVAAVPELGEENRENKAREKRRMEKRVVVVLQKRRREGMDEKARESINVQNLLRVLPVVA